MEEDQMSGSWPNWGPPSDSLTATENLSAVDDVLTVQHVQGTDVLMLSETFTSNEGAEVDRWIGNPSDLVCFGMIPLIPGKCERKNTTVEAFAVNFEGSDRFISTDARRGRVISTHYGHMIQGLLDETVLVLHTECVLDDKQAVPGRKTSIINWQAPCFLSITVYGPLELYDDIGVWLQEYDIYLQDPQRCHLNVRYCNPHRLSSEGLHSIPMLSEMVFGASLSLHLQDVVDRPDPLDILSRQDDLDETPQPQLVETTLCKHQKQALTFMRRRERGWDLEGNGSDIWGVTEAIDGQYFINRVSEDYQPTPPAHFAGGIIADPMGLGKTLTMLALIATDLETSDTTPLLDRNDSHQRPVQATLVVVPQPLLGTWERELSTHFVPDSVRFRRHHGRSKVADVGDIDAAHVILTTYHTLSADYKVHRQMAGHVMFSVRWKRIILDEAHVIRNMKSLLSHAICALHATSRWAVTGTPIQNHLSDLAALLKFIRAHPYDDTKKFDADISRLWKSNDPEEAVKRLKRLAHCLILRRAKRTIDLPPRRDTTCPVDFNTAERTLYENVRQQTLRKAEDALLHSDLSSSGIFVNFLQQIESMRLVCNLGIFYHNRHEQPSSHESSEWTSMAQETFNVHREMEIIACAQCRSILELGNAFTDDSSSHNPHFSRCLQYTCPDCSHKTRLAGHRLVCGHTPRCPVAPISLTSDSIEESIGGLMHPTQTSPPELPSKVRALIADLKSLAPDIKSIVFSTWRLTLDLVETGLAQPDARIRYVRFDGKVPQAQRQSVLDQFKSDPNIRVMLLTLSCGAVGRKSAPDTQICRLEANLCCDRLTLTEASRAYLMEPHWNPTIEDQALARIHRIGQTREVTTIRFYIRDSFEERVREVQESKKNLAGVLLSGHDGGQADDSLSALQVRTVYP
ncbi:uncharacterized protein EI97DRAFT_452386 [Westerdykella ornata]|uniref:Helicase ATP-binding domain-containing protein n=1 Tax=Westerdykella ornata TaxID=318751 RepID=A0A6A6JE50_WESOR|nr:uncharacterized protein EI97DRAFT_452386 [Westerdykella ornata]KAF2273459.1 hypothetical protein EI97DRAFT_452386 [Westerdykella ornata]